MSSNPIGREVHIIGAGFSGMSLALELAGRGCRVHVYDKRKRTGGMIESLPFHGAIVETAAHSITRTEGFEKLLQQIDLKPQPPSPTAKRRFIYRNGKIHQWPLGVLETLTMAFRFLKAQITKHVRPVALESIRNWGERVLGQGATRYLLEPAMQGIYAGDAKTLSGSLLLSPLFNRKRSQKRYSGVFSFPKGVAEMFPAMEKALIQAGGQLHLDRDVKLDTLQGVIVIATSLPAAAQLIGPTEANVSKVLSQLSMASLVTVTAHFHRRALNGFGCLIPRGEGPRVLGVLVNSCIFDRRWTIASESWIYGGATDSDFVNLGDEEIIKLLLSERKAIFGLDEKPKAIQITRWKAGLPNYDIHLERALAGLQPTLSQLEKNKGIYFHGNYLGGIGLSKILDRGQELADRLIGNEKSRTAAE